MSPAATSSALAPPLPPVPCCPRPANCPGKRGPGCWREAAKPLHILILGGTGFTGPHQVRYALSRGHKVTLFNRGRRPKEWPAAVEG